MKLPILKMQGLGNDFVIIDAISHDIALEQHQITWLADRHLGVGCDQVIVVSQASAGVYAYTIYNSDGSQVEQCGNGARCVAKYLRDQGLWDTEVVLQCEAGSMLVEHVKDNLFKVNMGRPKNIENHSHYTFVSMGNPHAVCLVDDVEQVDLIRQANDISKNFIEGINVGCMQVVSRREIQCRVHERGAGETQACGSGACAAVVAGVCNNLLDHEVTVHLPGGELLVQYAGGDQDVFMTGPAVTVFETVIEIT